MKPSLARVSVLVLAVMAAASVLVACGGSKATLEVPRPSNGPGAVIGLTGDAMAGEKVFVDNCQRCHGIQGTGGIVLAAGEPTVPSLNPIDPGLVSADSKTFATNIALFIWSGSMPAGSNITQPMTAFGDQGKLTPQQIADVIAYVISLNK